MIDDNISEIILLIVKIGAIFFAVIHLFVGIFLFNQVTQMRKIVTTKARGCVVFIGLLYIVLLLLVLVLIILIPV